MKKLSLLALLACVFFAFAGCKKSSPTVNATGTLTATIGGTSQTFNLGAIANLQKAGDSYTLGIIGVQSSTVSNSLIITIINPSTITAGTYTGVGSVAQMSYTLASGSIYQNSDDGQSSATVVIKSISSTTVQGTFSGTLELVNGGGPATETVTNGTFNLSIK